MCAVGIWVLRMYPLLGIRILLQVILIQNCVGGALRYGTYDFNVSGAGSKIVRI